MRGSIGQLALLNARHESFAQGLAQGMTGDEAYAAAGYKPNQNNASRLKGKESIKSRVAFLQGEAAERNAVTVDDIVRQLDEARALARERGNAAAMVSATMGKAKVLGLIVDKQVIGLKRIEDMNEHELRALLGIVSEGDARQQGRMMH